MIYNKKLVIGLLAAIIVIIGIAVTAALTMRSTKTADNSTDATPQATSSSSPLRIENFSSYPDIDITTKATITESIDHYIADVSHNSDPVGIVREGSYRQTGDGITSNIVFLVDIASLKRSYKIDLGSDISTGENSLYILCPAISELIYPAFDCKDDRSEE
jgi:hypothetical protein